MGLLEGLRKQLIITDGRIFNAMARVDRANFCKNDPYYDSPKSIGYGATISAPHMHAYALEYLKDKLQAGSKALDIGSGSGYLTAVMGILVSESDGSTSTPPNGKVIGVEHIPELVSLAIANVNKGNSDLLSNNIINFVAADGRQGYPKEAPYDAIHVGAAVESTPTTLINQLKPGGKLIAPVGSDESGQFLKLYIKNSDGNGFKSKTLLSVVYVPLTDQTSQRNRASVLSFWPVSSTKDEL